MTDRRGKGNGGVRFFHALRGLTPPPNGAIDPMASIGRRDVALDRAPLTQLVCLSVSLPRCLFFSVHEKRTKKW